MMGRVGCTFSALLNMVLAFTISQDDRDGGMHVCQIVEYGVGFQDS